MDMETADDIPCLHISCQLTDLKIPSSFLFSGMQLKFRLG